jgi:hypothetical protein
MISKKRLKSVTALALFGAAIAVSNTGCSDVQNLQGAACCTAFKVGTDMTSANFGVDASINASFETYAQAAGDLSATASATLSDVTTACQNIALDLGADPASVTSTGTQAATDWCKAAVDQINATFGASGTLAGKVSVVFTPPACSASVQATASCEAKCDVNASCDVQAHPPTCEGGNLVVDCKGECKVKGTASLACTGNCTGNCTGSCKASGGVAVDCKGKCDGNCTAGAVGGATADGTGIQADGTCNGQCDGTCTLDADAPQIQCSGVCDGHCDASCTGTADVAVRCDGDCTADYTPISCEGGSLKASCDVDADCEANCNASVTAKASCTPPSVDVVAEAKAGVDLTELTAAINTLKANLPSLFIAFEGRADAFATQIVAAAAAGGDIAVSGKLGVGGAVCAADILATIGVAGDNMAVAATAAGKVGAAVHPSGA